MAFCRIALGSMFGYSFLCKAFNVPAFEQAIIRFRLIPTPLCRLAALVFLCSELAMAVLMLLGGTTLGLGFLLAALLLLVFSATLVSVLARKIQTTCNCFGPKERPVSIFTVGRNIVFIVCAGVGWSIFTASSEQPANLGLAEWALIGAAAIAFVMFWTEFDSIVSLVMVK
jgi:hypothetical protein